MAVQAAPAAADPALRAALVARGEVGLSEKADAQLRTGMVADATVRALLALADAGHQVRVRSFLDGRTVAEASGPLGTAFLIDQVDGAAVTPENTGAQELVRGLGVLPVPLAEVGGPFDRAGVPWADQTSPDRQLYVSVALSPEAGMSP